MGSITYKTVIIPYALSGPQSKGTAMWDFMWKQVLYKRKIIRKMQWTSVVGFIHEWRMNKWTNKWMKEMANIKNIILYNFYSCIPSRAIQNKVSSTWQLFIYLLFRRLLSSTSRICSFRANGNNELWERSTPVSWNSRCAIVWLWTNNRISLTVTSTEKLRNTTHFARLLLHIKGDTTYKIT